MSLPSSSPPGCVSSMKMEVESASSNGGIPVENHTGGNGENDMDEASSTVKSSSSASRMSNSGSECSLPPSGLIQPPPREGPDPDGIKMFVGQVPKSMDEKDLKKMFEEFGEVYQINVLRDKVTKQSKGCCFVTFYTRKAALDAQNALHNIKTLPGMHHPIQMKPADTENRNERKLFIGMLSKKLGEPEIRQMFASYGQIEECTVLRDGNGTSRGCAFVTFTTRQSAISAIKAMHHSTTMEGCSSPMVVKFADTQKEKDQKRIQHMTQNLWGGIAPVTAGGPAAVLNPQYLALLQQMSAAGSAASAPNGPAQNGGIPTPQLTTTGVSALQLQQLLAMAQAQQQQQSAVPSAVTPNGLAGLLSAPTPSNPPPTQSQFNPSTADLNLQGLAALASMTNPLTATSTASQQSTSGNTAASALTPISLQNLATLAALTSGNNAGSVSPPSGSGSSLPGTTTTSASYPTVSVPTTSSSVATLLINGLSPANATAADLYGQQYHAHPQPPSHHPQTASAFPASVFGQPGAAPTAFATANGLISSASPMNGAAAVLSSAAAQAVMAAQSQGKQFLGVLPNFSQLEGPDGANLFIYHLPQDFSDGDLAQAFIPFGNVISAKVFIDKQTNLSKCFGFVSFDNGASAVAAINAMNGFQIGNKRLKVQLKRSKDSSKPY